jgi:cytoskeletal protein CcmA (bactofilin family)
MEPLFAKVHPGTNTYVIARISFIEHDLKVDGNLIVGARTYFWGNLDVSGALELGKDSEIKGDLIAASAVIGPNVCIRGSIRIERNLTLLDGARIGGDVLCGGNVLIRPGVTVDYVKAKGDVKLTGKTNIKRIQAEGKVTTTQ